MYSKIEISGEMELVTGMHIGGSDAFAAIGAIDSPVIKDVRTNLPIVPGSSLKGKLRTLIARKINDKICNPDDDDARIKRLFGCAKKGQVQRSRLIFSDLTMENAEELRSQGLTSMTEVKFENTINRCTGVANPRQIERAIRGTIFNFSVIYEVKNTEEIVDDIALFTDGLKLLTYDYLGGNGSRGYGKVKFDNLDLECVIGEVDDEIMEECRKYIKEV